MNAAFSIGRKPKKASAYVYGATGTVDTGFVVVMPSRAEFSDARGLTDGHGNKPTRA